MSQDPIFDSDHENDSDFFRIELWSFKFVFNPKRGRNRIQPSQPDLDPLGIVRKLLEDYESEENIRKSESVVSLHRVIENTHARRRLEKWSLRVIAAYLLAVFLIIVLNYADIPAIGLPWFKIGEKVMIAILTTTTANIIGLGLIVLRGHFLAKEADKDS